MPERIIRVRMSIKVSDQSPSNPEALQPLKPIIEQAIVSSLPDSFKVNTVKVTRINFAKPSEVGETEAS